MYCSRIRRCRKWSRRNISCMKLRAMERSESKSKRNRCDKVPRRFYETKFGEDSFVASLISHAVAALGIGTIFARPPVLKRVWIVGVVCAMLPDIDVVGFRLGIRYGDFWGHRGFYALTSFCRDSRDARSRRGIFSRVARFG